MQQIVKGRVCGALVFLCALSMTVAAWGAAQPASKNTVAETLLPAPSPREVFYQELLRSLGDEDPVIRQEAATKLGEGHFVEAREHLNETLMHDPESAVRSTTAYALGVVSLHRRPQPALTNALSDVNEGVRSEAAQSLRQVGDRTATEALIRALADPSDHVRVMAASALGYLDDPRAVPALKALLTTGKQEGNLRVVVLASLGQLYTYGGLESLLTSLKQGNPADRQAALMSVPSDRHLMLEQALHPFLSDPDPEMRIQTVYRLGAVGSALSIPALSRVLTDQDANLRLAALHTLSLFNDHRATPAICISLDDQDAGVRREAATALGVIGDPRASAPLLKHLADGEPQVRQAVVYALCQIRGDALLDTLLALARDPDAYVRQQTMMAFGYYAAPRAQALLLQALKDPEEKVRIGAILGLQQQRDPATFPQMRGMVNDPSRIVRSFALRTLGTWRDRQAVETILPLLKDQTAQVDAAAALKAIGDERACAPLRRVLAEQKDESCRLAAVSALGELKDRQAADAILPLLADPAFNMRRVAAYALARIGDSRAIVPTCALLADTSQPERVRGSAAKALGLFTSASATDALVRALSDPSPVVRSVVVQSLSNPAKGILNATLYPLLQDASPQVRAQTARVLGGRHEVAAVDHLLTMLADSSLEVRAAAVEALGELGDIRVAPALIGQVNEMIDQTLRAAVAEALGKLKAPEAIVSLITLLDDDNPLPRQNAAAALKAITGQSFGEDRTRWSTWWATQVKP